MSYSLWRWRWRVAFAIVCTLIALACATRRDGELEEESTGTFAADAGAEADAEPICPSNRCPPFRQDCNRDAGDGCEANIRSDVNHCGACDKTCLLEGGTTPPYTNAACLDGTCGYLCINDIFAGPMRNCTGADPLKGDPVMGCPHQLLCNPFHCGGCGIVAPLDPTGDRICANGVPLAACPAGTTNCHDGTCGDQCKNLNTDSNNCGQ
jgi:hypothetical protein